MCQEMKSQKVDAVHLDAMKTWKQSLGLVMKNFSYVWKEKGSLCTLL